MRESQAIYGQKSKKFCWAIWQRLPPRFCGGFCSVSAGYAAAPRAECICPKLTVRALAGYVSNRVLSGEAGRYVPRLELAENYVSNIF